jgi:DNA polymerase-3 subunit epsilon
MNSDDYEDLDARRAAAIAEDRCFSKGRLRDEFRMKPAPGAEPVRMYKSPYGGRYGVYRIADCVPMREKRPQTEKQQQAGARLGLQARMESQRGRSARLAYTWLSQDPVFLDTETTGLGNDAEALEIGLTDASGCVVFETRLKPTVSIEPAAAAVHGISDAELDDAPSWPDIAQQLQHHIGQRPLVIFNAGFDTRILKQTAAAHGDSAEWLDGLTVYCAMQLAADHYGATNRYGTISLASAVGQAGLSWSGRAHSAVTDAVMTAGVVNAISSYHRQLLQEQERLQT